MQSIASHGIPLFAREPVRHVDMSQALVRKTGRLICGGADRALVYLPNEGIYLFSAETPEAAEALIAQMTEPWSAVVAHARFLPDLLRTHFSLTPETHFCANVAYLGDPLPVAPVCELRPLDETALPFVTRLYHLTDDAYCLDRLRSGVMIGAFLDGAPVGFIGMHNDGSCGMLEVIPEARRRGIATALEAAMFNRLLARGWIPYGQIFEENDVSFALQERLHLARDSAQICWLHRI